MSPKTPFHHNIAVIFIQCSINRDKSVGGVIRRDVCTHVSDVCMCMCVCVCVCVNKCVNNQQVIPIDCSVSLSRGDKREDIDEKHGCCERVTRYWIKCSYKQTEDNSHKFLFISNNTMYHYGCNKGFQYSHANQLWVLAHPWDLDHPPQVLHLLPLLPSWQHCSPIVSRASPQYHPLMPRPTNSHPGMGEEREGLSDRVIIMIVINNYETARKCNSQARDVSTKRWTILRTHVHKM